jgi:DNA-binding MarR family transcriptional regulator
MPGSASPRPEPLLLYLIKQVELAARARLDDIVRPTGLTSLQYTALTVLERNDDMTSAALARNSFVTAQSMADMVAILQSHGFIERRRDASDRRRLLVGLTPAGRALLDRCRAEVTRLESCMVSGLSPSEVSELRHVLRACHRNLAQSSQVL